MKISVIGSGFVGMTVAYMTVYKELADEVAVVDILEGRAKGIALDIAQSTPIRGFSLSDTKIYGSEDYSIIKDSDIIIVTAGFPRKPGMDRIELLGKNADIIKMAAENIKKYSPEAIVIVITNPIDVMTYLMFRLLGVPRNQVVGQAGILDTARFQYFIADELKVSVKDVNTIVLGGHGDEMVPLIRFTNVGGVPVEQLIPGDRLQQIVVRTQKGGGEIVSLLKTGSAFYAPAAAAVSMAESIVKNAGRILPCSAFCDGEYGMYDVYVGVPVKLDKTGVAQIIQLPLSDDELKALHKSAEVYKNGIKDLYNLKYL